MMTSKIANLWDLFFFLSFVSFCSTSSPLLLSPPSNLGFRPDTANSNLNYSAQLLLPFTLAGWLVGIMIRHAGSPKVFYLISFPFHPFTRPCCCRCRCRHHHHHWRPLPSFYWVVQRANIIIIIILLAAAATTMDMVPPRWIQAATVAGVVYSLRCVLIGKCVAKKKTDIIMRNEKGALLMIPFSVFSFSFATTVACLVESRKKKHLFTRYLTLSWIPLHQSCDGRSIEKFCSVTGTAWVSHRTTPHTAPRHVSRKWNTLHHRCH